MRMGTKGLGDVAEAWIGYLVDRIDDPWFVTSTLEGVADREGRSDLQACEEAIAAAEIVAAAGRKARPELARDVLAWVELHWPTLWNGNRRLALDVVDKVLTSSALQRDQADGESYEAWRRDVEDLKERLS